MDGLANFNRAMQYIEDNLAEDLDLKEIARQAYCSEYHLSRMFSLLAGITLSEYIRRRRLTLAAFELQTSDVRIIDVAIKYGYNSADAFSRAFQALHGMTPSTAKSNGSSLKAYPRMTFQLTIQGGSAMNYRIVEEGPFRIVGIKRRIPIQFHGVNSEIESMWRSLTEENILELKALSDIEPRGLIQASANFSEERMEEKGSLDHYIGVATRKECPDHLTELRFQVVHGRYLKRWVHSRRHCRTCGAVSIQNGFLPQVTSWREVRKYCGTKVRIYLLQPSEARFGYLS